MTKEEFVIYLKARTIVSVINNGVVSSKEYDKYYQDIDCIGFKGYSESFKSWDNIKNLIDWKDKTVADLGCFHCYFSIKAAKMGAIVTGLEKFPEIVETANIINQLEGNIIKVKQWISGQDLPQKYDVILCMNVLHHMEDQKLALKKMDCRYAIFEINKEQESLVNEYFTILKRVPSHRENRIILLTEKNNG